MICPAVGDRLPCESHRASEFTATRPQRVELQPGWNTLTLSLTIPPGVPGNFYYVKVYAGDSLWDPVTNPRSTYFHVR